jgi:RecA/RadA recombinase
MSEEPTAAAEPQASTRPATKKGKAKPEAVPPANAAEALARARAAVEARGGRLYTVAELGATREDFLTGCAPFDLLMRGPMAAGWRIALQGVGGAGKSTLARAILTAHLRAFPDRVVVYFDIEDNEEGDQDRAALHGWRDQWGERVLIVKWAGTGEGLYDTLVDMIRERVPISCICLDSLNGLCPRGEFDGDLDASQQRAQLATMMSDMLRRTTGLLAMNHITQLWIFQRRDNPQAGAAAPKAIGNATKHYSDLRIEFNGGIEFRSYWLGDEKHGYWGAKSGMKLARKRKGHGRPLDAVEFAITFDGGLDRNYNLVRACFDRGLLGEKIQCVLDLPADRRSAILAELSAAGVLDAEGRPAPPPVGGKPPLTIEEGVMKVRGAEDARLELLANYCDDAPTLSAHLHERLVADFPAPRLAVYPGAWTYPTGGSLQALLDELDAGGGNEFGLEVDADA